MSGIDKVERKIKDFFEKLRPAKLAPMEIRRAVIREIGDMVQPRGKGEYYLPFRSVRIDLFYQDEAERMAIEGLFELASLRNELQSELASLGCRGGSPELSIEYIECPGDKRQSPYRVAPASGKEPPAARLKVLKGAAGVSELVITKNDTTIGRGREVVSRGRVVRWNHLWFHDSENTVARMHATIRCVDGVFRLFGERGKEALINREGLVRPKKCDAALGCQLRTGDVILLGEARILFETDFTAPSQPSRHGPRA